MNRIRVGTFQVGSTVKREQGLRIAVTRRPPRGIPRKNWTPAYFDVWLPSLAPSNALLSWAHKAGLQDPERRKRFFQRYQREVLGRAESRQTIDLLKKMARRVPVSIGCHCADENMCHRSHLLKLILKQSL
jgi:uncharacterized protein YeaO (DUF488 family)